MEMSAQAKQAEIPGLAVAGRAMRSLTVCDGNGRST